MTSDMRVTRSMTKASAGHTSLTRYKVTAKGRQFELKHSASILYEENDKSNKATAYRSNSELQQFLAAAGRAVFTEAQHEELFKNVSAITKADSDKFAEDGDDRSIFHLATAKLFMRIIQNMSELIAKALALGYIDVVADESVSTALDAKKNQ